MVDFRVRCRRVQLPVSPQVSQVHLCCLEGDGSDCLVATMSGKQNPVAGVEAVDLDCLCKWIYEPEMGHADSGIDGQFLGTIVAAGRRRENFAHPVRRQRDESVCWRGRHAFSAPTCEIRNQYVLVQVELGLVEDPPAAGSPAVAELKWREQRPAERGSADGVRSSRSRTDYQLTTDDLTDDVLGECEQVLIGRRSAGCQRHPSRVAQDSGTLSFRQWRLQ
jgi:hypothetical protein